MATDQTAYNAMSVCVLCASIPLSHIHRITYRLNSLVTGSLIVTLATQLPVKALLPEHNNNNNKRTPCRDNSIKQSSVSYAADELAGQHSTCTWAVCYKTMPNYVSHFTCRDTATTSNPVLSSMLNETNQSCLTLPPSLAPVLSPEGHTWPTGTCLSTSVPSLDTSVLSFIYNSFLHQISISTGGTDCRHTIGGCKWNPCIKYQLADVDAING